MDNEIERFAELLKASSNGPFPISLWPSWITFAPSAREICSKTMKALLINGVEENKKLPACWCVA